MEKDILGVFPGRQAGGGGGTAAGGAVRTGGTAGVAVSAVMLPPHERGRGGGRGCGEVAGAGARAGPRCGVRVCVQVWRRWHGAGVAVPVGVGVRRRGGAVCAR